VNSESLLVSRVGRLGVIRLNRPTALNSLTLGMVQGFARALDEFGADAKICAVLVSGTGERGLCAGGDIRGLYELRGATHNPYKQFWREEYRLNARIASFPKPYVVVMDGVVMGGGVGISAHGNRRLVTERTRLAMPETGIGFIPDVGGTWLLTRDDSGVGIYLALSGTSVSAADAISLGLADFSIGSADIPRLMNELATVQRSEDVDAVLLRFTQGPGPGVFARHRSLLETAMANDRIEGILASLAADNSDFARQAILEIGSKSPTSLRVTHELLKCARFADKLESCLTREFRAACRLLETSDLYEGVRAALIDKDKRPHWSPATLAEVSEDSITAILQGTGDPEPAYQPWAQGKWGSPQHAQSTGCAVGSSMQGARG